MGEAVLILIGSAMRRVFTNELLANSTQYIGWCKPSQGIMDGVYERLEPAIMSRLALAHRQARSTNRESVLQDLEHPAR